MNYDALQATRASWTAMRRRCLKPSAEQWQWYGGRGIRICARWDNFEVFLADMGLRPCGKTLDRIDTNGHYNPTNCRWATQREQVRGQRKTIRVTYYGETLLLVELCERLGLSYMAIYLRMTRYGRTLEQAIRGDGLRKRLDHGAIARFWAGRAAGVSYRSLATELGCTVSALEKIYARKRQQP
jgi:hypothetical protein